MKAIQPMIAVILIICNCNFLTAQVCNPAGNVIIYSNYDGSGNTAGTRLNINVDANIPNLKIGICSYERVTVNISGAFVGNVTGVIYAGMDSRNNHCGSAAATVITGVPIGIISYYIAPAATLPDPNGNPSIICGTTCTSGPTGGCNTSGQLVHYFVTTFGAGSVFRFHETQYGCWAGTTKNVSSGGNCCITPLPVELISFKSYCNKQGKPLLTWSTASETNNDFFTIERSVDASDFKMVAIIDGAGNSNQILSYQWTDNEYFSGTVYYRLKQTDYNGNFKYIALSSVNANCSNQSNLLQLINNPADNKISLYFSLPYEDKTVISVFDLTGKKILEDDFIASEGNNLFTLDISSLQKGIYFISLTNKDFSVRQKFIKQ